MRIIEKPNEVRSESGFSLIEVCIGLIVIGLLMGPIIHTYNLFIKSRQIALSQAVTNIVHSALIKHVEKYGYYPKPSNPSIAQGVAGFGAEDTATSGWPTCTATSTVVCQTTANTYGGGIVLIGDVPFATLGIPFKSILDGYNKKLTYAVTWPLTSSGTFTDGGGAIEVLNDAGTSIYTGTADRSHFAVISHGEDGNGAFTLSGVRSSACGTTTTGIQFENCNNDGRFVNNLSSAAGKTVRNYASGATYFDDFVATTNTVSTGLWSYIPNSSLKMESSNDGNVYIGTCATSPCIPKAHVEVNGDVKSTTTILTNRICPKDSANCVSNYSTTETPRENPTNDGWFSPDMLTGAPNTNPTATSNPADPNTQGYEGAGIRCYDYKALRGIKAYDEVCGSNSSSGDATSPYFAGTVNISGTCTSGKYANKITISGSTITLTCASP